jgi:hypothetical protein
MEREKKEKEEEKERKRREASTTASLNMLVNGFSTQSPTEEIVVDLRDSLFNTLFSPTKEKKTFGQRLKLGGKVCFWVGTGAQHFVQTEKGRDVLVCLSPESIIHSSSGAFVLCRPSSFFVTDELGAEKLKPERGIWHAPEILRGEEKMVNEKTIVFSLALITFCVMSGRMPYGKMVEKDVMQKIVDGERPSLEMFEKEKNEIGEMLKRMWDGEVEKRMGLLDVMSNTFSYSNQQLSEETTSTETEEDSVEIQDS